MNSWSDLLNESQKLVTPENPNASVQYLLDKKDEFIKKLSEKTGRYTILYFSAFMHKLPNADAGIVDKDINAFMETIHNMKDRSKGVDIILHTPGGDLAATEQIIYYLRSAFDGNIRAIVPQMAMSAGSMIAVSCKEIVMGRQSCLGPFDPQLNGIPCQSVIKEFYSAVEDIEKHPASIGLWQTIISKLTPTFITQCRHADQLASDLTDMILSDRGFSNEIKENIKSTFSQNKESKIHNRHINRDKCKEAGLTIVDLEKDQEIQDLVLGIHHTCMILSEQSNILKIVQNNIEGAYLIHVPMQIQQK